MKPVSSRNTGLALRLLGLDLVLFALAIAATVWLRNPPLKLLCGMAAGLLIARLFILGHDACHQSYTSHRRLNAWLGRLAFLPSLTPYSLWDVGHNIVHHGYTNLKDVDMVWRPHTLEEFRALPPWRRALERIYRSGWAPWLYYLIDMWWLRMYFPSKCYMPTRRREFVWDSLLVSFAALIWIATLVSAAIATGQSALLIVTAGFAVPFLVWNGLIGFVVYVHHTHPRVAWYEDKAGWSAAQPFVSTTVHLHFDPVGAIDMDAMLHHIMQHTAHHVDMGIPLYRLKQAQAILEVKIPEHIVVQRFSWRWYFDTARRCKLYDYQARCWTDFSGVPTSKSHGKAPAKPVLHRMGSTVRNMPVRQCRQ